MVGCTPLCYTTTSSSAPSQESSTLNSAEDPSSFGSHFLINGNEKLVRLLQMQRKNHPLALNRAAYTNRGKGYTTLGVTVRCGKTGGGLGRLVTLSITRLTGGLR